MFHVFPTENHKKKFTDKDSEGAEKYPTKWFTENLNLFTLAKYHSTYLKDNWSIYDVSIKIYIKCV